MMNMMANNTTGGGGGGGTNNVGFFFQRRQGKFNWRYIADVDIDRVASQVDVDALQAYLEHITFSDITRDDLMHASEANCLKLMRMYQLTIEYLLNVQNYLLKGNNDKENEVQKLNAQIIELQHADKQKAVEIKAQKRELRIARRVLKAYEGSVKNMNKPGGMDKRVTVAGDVVYKCAECSAAFISEQFLMKHMMKRHPQVEYNGALIQPQKIVEDRPTSPSYFRRNNNHGGGGGGGVNNMSRGWFEQWGDKVKDRVENTIKMQNIRMESQIAERLSRMQSDFKMMVQSELASMIMQQPNQNQHRRKTMAGPLFHVNDDGDDRHSRDIHHGIIHDKLNQIIDNQKRQEVFDGVVDRRTNDITRDIGDLRTLVALGIENQRKLSMMQPSNIDVLSPRRQYDEYPSPTRYNNNHNNGDQSPSMLLRRQQQPPSATHVCDGNYVPMQDLPFVKSKYPHHRDEVGESTMRTANVLDTKLEQTKFSAQNTINNERLDVENVWQRVNMDVERFHTLAPNVAGDARQKLDHLKRQAAGVRGILGASSPTTSSFMARKSTTKYGQLSLNPVREYPSTTTTTTTTTRRITPPPNYQHHRQSPIHSGSGGTRGSGGGSSGGSFFQRQASYHQQQQR